MKKVFLFFFLCLILIFLFYKKDSLISNIEPFSPKVLKNESIVKNDNIEKVIDIPQEKLKTTSLEELEMTGLKRGKECENNDPYFKKRPIDTRNLKSIIDDLFNKGISEYEADEIFQKYIHLLESKKDLDLNNFRKTMDSIQGCRWPESMNFLDRIIESKKIDIPYFLQKLNNNMLGKQFNSINLAMVFGKLAKMSSLGLLPKDETKEIMSLRQRFLQEEDEFVSQMNNPQNHELARDIFIDHYKTLTDIGLSLKETLDRISSY